MIRGLRSIFSKRHLAYFVAAIVVIVALPLISTYLPWNRSAYQSDPADRGFLITEVIRQVRQELYDAQVAWNEAGENAMFEVDYFDLELTFVLKRTVETGAEAKLQLMAVSSNTNIGTERIQRIKLHMNALPPRPVSLKASSTESDSNATTTTKAELIKRRKE